MLIAWLLSCNPPESVFDTHGLSSPEPELLEVTARCNEHTRKVVVRARTYGWTKRADFDVWQTMGAPQSTDTDAPTTELVLIYQEVPLPTVGFTPPPDELCDVMQAEIDLPPKATCDMLTYSVRVQYEEDCAGCSVFGHDAAGVYKAADDPDPNDADCHINALSCQVVGLTVEHRDDDALTCVEAHPELALE